MAGRNPDIPAQERLPSRVDPVLREAWFAIRGIGRVLYEALDKAVDAGIATASDEIDLFMLRNGNQARVQSQIEHSPHDTTPKSA